MADLNGLAVPEPADFNSIIQLFELQAAQKPDQAALRFDGEEISYLELNQKAAQRSAGILQSAIEADLIAISTTRSVNMIIDLLAILKAGKAYLPLDTTLPADRLKQMIADAGIKYCLAPVTERQFFEDLGLELIVTTDTAFADASFISQNLVYVLYTSGSTGVPKGVCMGKKALLNLLLWQKEQSAATNHLNTLQFAPLGFDVSFQEIFATLCFGGTLVLIDQQERINPAYLLQYIKDQQIARLFLPFVALQFLAEEAVTKQFFPDSLKEIITAGEQLKITPQIKRFFKAIPGCTLANQYGPTECHVVTQFLLDGDADNWPALPAIGKPVSQTQILLLDDDLQEVAAGESGELCLAGVCLADGYLNRPQLTAEKFPIINGGVKEALRIYKTGDLARMLPDGNLEFLGRKDQQIKIRGYRIEPGEIESLLNGFKSVSQSVVIAREDEPGITRLTAYLVASADERNTTEIRENLAQKLPDYMLPAAFIWLKELPYTPSGKIDKKRLPKPQTDRPQLSTVFKTPETPLEIQIAENWCKLLSINKIGINDSFFELGGNSLLAVKSTALLNRSWDYELSVTKIYQYPTAARLAKFLTGGEHKAAPQIKVDKRSISHDIAVIGMACRFPGASSVEEFWDILKDGKETIRFFSAEELDSSVPDGIKNHPDYVSARGILDTADQFDASFFNINPKTAELMDPQHRILLELAYEVLEKTGYLSTHFNGATGVFAGSGNNTYYLHNILRNQEVIDHLGDFQVMALNEKDYIASRLAYQLNLKGPAISVYSACSTAALAIAQAAESIRNGNCDIALAGASAVTSPVKSGSLYQDGAMFSKNGHTRPFDADAAGTVFSDGAGIVLLKSLESAERDGDPILAVLKGEGVNNDGFDKSSFTAPSANGQSAAIKMALQNAGISAGDVSYIEAHGTATPIGDPIEIEGLKLAFGGHQQRSGFCAIGSVKGNFGHTTAAAGVAGFIKTVLCITKQQIPASVNHEKPNPEIQFAGSPFFVNTKLTDWQTAQKRVAGVSSFGVGGTNVHLILEEYQQKQPKNRTEKTTSLVSWSAKSAYSLNQYARKLLDFTEANEKAEPADIAYSLHKTRPDHELRRFIVASDRNDLKEKLRLLIENPPQQTSTKEELKVAFLFPGQGSASLNMNLELYREEAVFREAVDECALLLLPHLQEDIRKIIYPAEENDSATEKLDQTCYAQPAVFTMQYAAAKLWMSWGVQPSAVCGHSFGEYMAACLAGIFSLADALKLVAERARLMQTLPAGRMLVIKTSRQKLDQLLPDDVSLAAVNSTDIFTVSGAPDDVKAFAKVLNNNDIPCRMLDNKHAFHSWMMEPILGQFQEIVKTVEVNAPKIPLVSTATGTFLTDAEAQNSEYWCSQIRKPVLFDHAITTLLGSGQNFLLDIGPGNTLAALLRQRCQQNRATFGSASAPSLDKQSIYSGMLKILGLLWLRNFKPNWNALYQNQDNRIIDLPTYVFDRKKCWVDPPLKSALHKQLTNDAEDLALTSSSFITPKTSEMNALKQEIGQILCNATGLEPADLQHDATFIEMGMDSLLLTQISLLLSKKFKVQISFRNLNEHYNTIDLLSNYLQKHVVKEAVTKSVLLASDENHHIKRSYQTTADQKDVIGLLAQQISLISQQINIIQHGQNTAVKEASVAQPLKIGPSELSGEEAAEIKKPFGATARIQRSRETLTQKQLNFITDLTKRYNAKTAKSKAHSQQNRAFMADPRVVSGFSPATKEMVYPLIVDHSSDCHVWDIDGNEYVDALNGFGSNLLGYRPDFIADALKNQIDKGFEIGPQHPFAGEVCRMICDFTKADRAALCNTGSEAVLGAMRVARTVTGRSLIVAFSGSYHGIIDEVIVRGTKKLISVPAAPGIMPEAVQNMLILDYGTPQSLQIIKERAHELAAVLVEPVQSRRPEYQPVEFLKELRKITEEAKTPLIFDEVITGFRMHPGGAQALMEIKADIGTYGKVIGGGLSIGVIAGKKEYMDALDGGYWQYGDDSVPEAGVTYFAGTFVRHPLALAAAKATLSHLEKQGPLLQQNLNQATQKMCAELNNICKNLNLPAYIASFGSLWKIKFSAEHKHNELLFTLMRLKGVHIWDNFPCFLTTAHASQHINKIITAFHESAEELAAAGFLGFEESSILPKVTYTKEAPPVLGARLGKDKQGNPAWFIEQSGKFIQIKTNLV